MLTKKKKKRLKSVNIKRKTKNGNLILFNEIED